VHHHSKLASPNQQQQQQGTTPTDHHSSSSDSPRIAFPSSLSPKIMVPNRPHHAAPIISTTKYHSSSLSLHNDIHIVPSDSTGSPCNKYLEDSLVIPTPNIAHNNMDFNQSNFLLVFTEISSQVMTHCIFFMAIQHQ